MGAVRDSSVEGIARTGVEGARDPTAADIVVDSEQGAKRSELTRLSRRRARLTSRDHPSTSSA